jgi:peroxiredoxin
MQLRNCVSANKIAVMLPLRTLSETMATLRQELGAPLRRLYDDLVRQLTEAAIAEGAVKRGDVFPEFALPDTDGKFTLLSELLKLGPLVINFYRGQWCPFCSATIEAVSAATPAIRATGATVIGISPELGGLSFSASSKRNLNFTMLCDVDNGVALQCGLVFRLTNDIIQDYLADGFDLAQVYGNSSWFLPIPASYIVMPNGTISWAYVNPDFRYRMAPEEILHAVEELKSR